MKETCEECRFKVGDTISDQYTVISVLGEGSFGCVYQVQSPEDRIYALKLMKLWEIADSEHTSYQRRFEMEYETGKIGSAYLIHTYDKGMVQGNPYLVMEYCSKGDLLNVINSNRANVSKYVFDILYGLQDLHNSGKVHRDLKPENILIRDDDTALLTDFGIAGDQNNRMTKYNMFGVPRFRGGTWYFMSPEQNIPPRGDAIVLPTTDIFSFGVMMFLLFTGEFPFGKIETNADVPLYLEKARKGKWNRKLLQKNTDGLWTEIIEKCLVPDYKKRMQSVEEILELFPNRPKRTELKGPNNFGQGLLLRIMQGEEFGKTYKVNSYLQGGRRIVTIGRNSGKSMNEINLEERFSSYISRHHCTLECDEKYRKWFIRDGQWRDGTWHESRNGTYVGSKEVGQRGMSLQLGDIITLGDLKMRVECYNI